ncbi:MAG TPA: ABC transporter substrate-binding protein, partial [Oligoflexia bacterium]|nr:ABC transporter substrate-binding protein [Oligoflexia bacterium]
MDRIVRKMMRSCVKTTATVMSLTILVLYGIPHESRADFSIGVIAPLTGPRSDGGTYIKQAAETAEEDLARSSGGMIRFILEDSGYEPAKAVTAFKKLVEIDGVSLIVGPYGSSEVLAVAPLAERAKKIIIAPGAQSDEISTAGDYVFRTIHNSAQEGPFFAPHVAKRMNGVELAVLAIQTAFSPSY